MRTSFAAWLLLLALIVLTAPVVVEAQAHIAFTRDYEIRIMREDGTIFPDPLTEPAPDLDFRPSICPSGLYIYFDRSSGGQSDIWKIGSDGTGLTQITDTPSVNEEDPYCGSNGLFTYILFRSNEDDPLGDIYRMDLNGSNSVRLTQDNDPFFEDRDPAWCGTNQVVFTRYDGHDYEIFIMDLQDGGNLEQITDNYEHNGFPIIDEQPVCSSNGQLIAFSRTEESNYVDIWTLDRNTQTETNRTENIWEYGWELFPTFSPGGNWIAFRHFGDTVDDEGIYKLSLSPIDPKLIRLTNDPEPEFDLFPDWGELD